MLALVDQHAVRAVEVENDFNSVTEFTIHFQEEIASELLPLPKIKYNININIISESSQIPTYRPSGDRFKQQIKHKINSEEI